MALVPSSVARQAELLKADGNTYFKKERIGAAIDAYTEAITLCPNVAVYRTNRALCYWKRKEWDRVEEDCRKAIELDSSSVKGHYMLGLALLEHEDHSGGIKELEKAFDLERGAHPTGYMVEEIWQTLSKAKYTDWERESSERFWKYQYLKECCEKALVEQNFLDASESKDEAQLSEQLQLLEEVFSKVAKVDKPTEVPDFLCCRITLDILRDPIITPSGVTYERAVLLEHLQKVGNFDPITREPLDSHQLVPNLAIKEAVRAFLNDHGWAYE
ncbi:E3 ubiquitin-protein ligase CHIP [Iris pallida]|uniref:E3 ubiquitin-protein ligase CHIP n=2 Tax=Iris pallida TaxID=29817 RepID=A0AAX6ECZ8_IRIPA|nr:E3 ubiquitin-protein ligase CHIP [Iris pallida]